MTSDPVRDALAQCPCCLQFYEIDLEYRCGTCDEPVCPFCVLEVAVGQGLLCPICAELRDAGAGDLES